MNVPDRIRLEGDTVMPSSVIARMTYDPEARVLEILYRGERGRYRYFDVPVEEWRAFRTSASKGTYLNEVFKTKNYAYERMEHEAEFLEGEGWGYSL